MPGFAVAAFVTGMTGARVLRIAPNGDIFLARSRPEGKVMVIRAKPGAEQAGQRRDLCLRPDATLTASRSIRRGPIRNGSMSADTGKVVRFPYNNGDLKASGAPQTVVSDLADRR